MHIERRAKRKNHHLKIIRQNEESADFEHIINEHMRILGIDLAGSPDEECHKSSMRSTRRIKLAGSPGGKVCTGETFDLVEQLEGCQMQDGGLSNDLSEPPNSTESFYVDSPESASGGGIREKARTCDTSDLTCRCARVPKLKCNLLML